MTLGATGLNDKENNVSKTLKGKTMRFNVHIAKFLMPSLNVLIFDLFEPT
jgi:hypothetical protein